MRHKTACLRCSPRTALELALFSFWFPDLALPAHESAATLRATLGARLSQRSEKTNERHGEIEKGRYQRRIEWSWHTARVRPKWLNLIPRRRRRRGRPLVESTLVCAWHANWFPPTDVTFLSVSLSLSLPFRRPDGRKTNSNFDQTPLIIFFVSPHARRHATLRNREILRCLGKTCINHRLWFLRWFEWRLVRKVQA